MSGMIGRVVRVKPNNSLNRMPGDSNNQPTVTGIVVEQNNDYLKIRQMVQVTTMLQGSTKISVFHSVNTQDAELVSPHEESIYLLTHGANW